VIQKINAGAEKGSAMKYICAYGRFGFDCIDTDRRVLSPMKRVNGQLEETTWSDALKVVAEGLKKAGKDTGFVSSAGFANEDALALKDFADKAVKTKHYDSTMSLYADGDSLINSDSASINDADLIILVGINPSQRLRILPMLNVSIRRRVARGAKLIVINSKDTRLDQVATVKLSGNEISDLKALVRAAADKGAKADAKLTAAVKDAKVSGDAEKAGELMAGASNPIVYTSPALFDASSNLSLLKGHTIAVAYESNAKGLALMGLESKGKTFKQMVSDGAKALYVVGSPPIRKRPDCDFLVVQDSHFSEIAKQADVFLPATTFYESAGTIVDFRGRLKYVPKMIEPIGDSKTHREVFQALAKLMDVPLKKPTEADVKRKVKVKPKHVLRPFEKKEGMDVLPEAIIEAGNEAVIASPRLLWLKETEKSTPVSPT
jgi:predicted molibdopterin-dependent oxidoreductase YjgC